MLELLRGRIILSAFLFWATLFPISAVLNLDDLFALLTGLNVVTSTMVLVMYSPALIKILKLKQEELDYSDLLTLGIMVSWFSILARILFLGYFRQFGKPLLIGESYPLALIQWMTFTAGILHLSARQVLRGGTPHSSFGIVFGTIAGGVGLGTVLALTN